MSFPLPQSWTSAWPIIVTKCARNTMGGTDVEAIVCGAELAPFTFREYDVDRQGFDELRPAIEAMILGQVADALRLAR